MVPASVRAGGYCDGDENESDGGESTKTKKRRSGGVADVGGAPLSAHTPLSAVQARAVPASKPATPHVSDRMRSASKRLVLVTPRAFLCPSFRAIQPWALPRHPLPITPGLALLL